MTKLDKSSAKCIRTHIHNGLKSAHLNRLNKGAQTSYHPSRWPRLAGFDPLWPLTSLVPADAASVDLIRSPPVKQAASTRTSRERFTMESEQHLTQTDSRIRLEKGTGKSGDQRGRSSSLAAHASYCFMFRARRPRAFKKEGMPVSTAFLGCRESPWQSSRAFRAIQIDIRLSNHLCCPRSVCSDTCPRGAHILAQKASVQPPKRV